MHYVLAAYFVLHPFGMYGAYRIMQEEMPTDDPSRNRAYVVISCFWVFLFPCFGVFAICKDLLGQD